MFTELHTEEICMEEWIRQLYQQPEMLKMGHWQRAEDLNLGLGWIYYGLVRVIRPQRVVVIGSWRGFTPMVFAKALADNREGGRLLFVDPSYADDFWRDPETVRSYFARFGLTNIDHRQMTTQQFMETEEYDSLHDVGLVFIDGLHSAEQAAIDYGAFENRMSPYGAILFHDSIWYSAAKVYIPVEGFVHRVVDFITELKKRDDLQVFDLPFAGGVTMVRKAVTPPKPVARSISPDQTAASLTSGPSSLRS
jgi:predicted O-methyltransferase YrrM